MRKLEAFADSRTLGRMSPDEAVQSYMTYLGAERRGSVNTIDAYRRDIRSLLAFVTERYPDRAGLSSIDVYVLRGWLGQLARTHSPASVARKISAVRSFMRWLLKKRVLTKNPAEEILSPKVRRPLPTLLSVDAAKQVANLSLLRYKEGLVSYLEVVVADRTALENEILAYDLNGQSIVTTVQLIKALGGGWNANSAMMTNGVAPLQKAE